MSGKYTLEDLLKLRASPLICKPATLPAIEDIIAPQDANIKRPSTRGKVEDPVTQEGFQKRPLSDSQQRKSASDPDKIVLGPPRRSFASSNARAAGRFEKDGADASPISREKYVLQDRLKNGENADSKYQDKRNGRQVNRHDQDTSLPERTRRRREEDDGEAKPHKDLDRDRPKWGGRDHSQPLDEERNDDESKPGARRDTQSRAKFDQSWFRHDRGGESLDDTKKDGDRHDWRRDRGREREWDRTARVEADPEWMDAAEPEEPAQVHTQEEFQRWKEKMKAGSAATDTKQEPAQTTPPLAEERATKHKMISEEADDSMDKFFARFNEPKVVTEQKTAPAKAPTKTRFASLFGPAPEAQPKQTVLATEHIEPPVREKSAPLPAATPINQDADQAGFARILEMLQTRNSNPASPGHDAKSKAPLYARDNQQRPDMEGRQSTGLMSLFGGEPPQQTHPAQNRLAGGLDQMADSRSPNELSHTRQQSNKDELLLNLLRQANLAAKPPQVPQHHEQRPPPGMFGVPDAMNRGAIARNQMVSPTLGPEPAMLQRRETGRSMFDEPPMRYQDQPGPHEHQARRPTNGAPPPFFEDPYFAGLRQSGQPNPQQQKPAQGNQQPQGPPPGLGRPPGLDQMQRMPPGWPGPQGQAPPPQQQQQPPRPTAPPGMQNIPRNMPPPYGAPNMPPQQLQSQSQRLPQRQYAGEPGMPNFPPGMVPPPGFMSNGPPPGFPGGPQNYGRFPEQPQGAGRAFMEMYGDGGRPGLRGGAGGGGMPGYR